MQILKWKTSPFLVTQAFSALNKENATVIKKKRGRCVKTSKQAEEVLAR
jgi:hypothetical protein